MGNKRDLTGMVFARLTVAREIPERQKKKIMWECVCECGETTKAAGSHLLSGRIRSCGCLQREWVLNRNNVELSGQTFGRLTVVERSGRRTRNGKTLWICRCECGNSITLATGTLRSGTTRSCGCLRSDVTARLKYSHGKYGTREYKNYWSMRRYAVKKQRMPKWADRDAIRIVYQNCPQGLHVDHIIPLQGELVSGLHVQGNLQYLSPGENSAKNNRFAPQFITR